MLGLPKSTEVNKRIPKQKFYANLTVSPALKRMFSEQIRVIFWRNKIAASTMNLAAGAAVTEIEVFEVKLTAPQLDMTVLRQIDREVPYHIVFLLEYDNRYQVWAAYKELAASGSSAFKVGPYYHTEWLPEAELPVTVDGLNLDTVYENFVRQISGGALQTGSEETLKDSVERDERRRQVEKQIAALEAQIRKEKQLNKQVQLNAELKKLKREFGMREEGK